MAQHDEQNTKPDTEVERPDDAPENTEEPKSPEVDEGKDDLPEWAREKLTKANGEAANYRTKLREVEAKLEAMTPSEEVEKLKAELIAEREKAEADAKAEARDLLIENVALTFKIPAALKARLKGETREELEADAKDLASLFASSEDDDEPVLEGGLSPRNRDIDPDDPAGLAKKYGRRRKR